MRIQDVYRWEAEMADGSVVTGESPVADREDMTRCVCFRLLPSDGVPLPKHEIRGVKMARRFCRGFQKHVFHRKTELPGKLFWRDGADEMRVSEDWSGLLQPGDFIGKGVDGEQWYEVVSVDPDWVRIGRPYSGKSKPNGMFCRMMKRPADNPEFVYLHCVVCDGFRVWFNYGTGAALVTPVDHEYYL